MFWTDNMLMPYTASNPKDAMTYMDYVYDPKVQAVIEAYNNYVCPVPSSKGIIATELHDPAVANSPLVFPTRDDRSVEELLPVEGRAGPEDVERHIRTDLPVEPDAGSAAAALQGPQADGRVPPRRARGAVAADPVHRAAVHDAVAVAADL